MSKNIESKDIDKIIQDHLGDFRKTGVLTVRPGYEIRKNRLTGSKAIVATVHTKKAKRGLTNNEKLRDSIEGIPVDVREATAHQRLRAVDPGAAALTQIFGRPESREPEWSFEREIPSGELLASSRSQNRKVLAEHEKKNTLTHRALASHAKKPQLAYVPAKDSLDPVTVTAAITAHVSPDAGLKTLEAFLDGTTNSLTVGMYDFTSGTILSKFESVLTGKPALQMVLDNPAPNPTRNQTDTQTVEDLNERLKGRAKIVRALTRSDPFAAKWCFPSAYHIKVIVRDGTAFWLSSGNLNNSNQPDLASPPTTEDRDWHVIIENEELAKLFADVLDQDFQTASKNQTVPPAHASTVADAQSKLAAHSNPPPPRRLSPNASSNVPAKTFKTVTLRVTPLLTPDKLQSDPNKQQYFTRIVDLINSATKSLYIQLQYIESSKDGTDYDKLLAAIGDRVKAGVDVRLIESSDYGVKWAEKMKDTGVDLTDNIRLQKSVHNKGFVVDSKIAVVSSQNFSPAGIEQNRDAGVILENADIAKYFEAVFLSDWTDLAKPFGSPRSVSKKTSHTKKPANKATKKKR